MTWETRATWASSRATWLALAGSIWPRLARSGCPARLARATWLALAGSIWPRLGRFGCPARPGRPAERLGSPWLARCGLDLVANECPIDAISKKNRFGYRRSCFDAAYLDAACFVRSGTFPHASNLIHTYFRSTASAAGMLLHICIYIF